MPDLQINITALDAGIIAGCVVCDLPPQAIEIKARNRVIKALDILESCQLENGLSTHSFAYRFCPNDLCSPVDLVSVLVRLADGVEHSTKSVKIPVVQPDVSKDRPAWVLQLPFAPELSGQLYDMGVFKNTEKRPSPDDSVYLKAAKAVRSLARYGSPDIAGPARHMLLYLRSLAQEFSQIAAYWPKDNRAQPDFAAKDSAAMLTTPEEMLVIAAYLYVLKQHGLQGNFCEFGCFTGFSTACLSVACHRLGIKMDCFDSFAGLPVSDSAYYKAGDFACNQATVERNLACFGKPECVTFHKGFFDRTVPKYKATPISLWLDVDLTDSARAIMPLLAKQDGRAGLFSNECLVEHFGHDGRVKPKGGPDDPATAIAEICVQQGTDLTGFFVTGDTGFFAPDKTQTIMCPTLDMIKKLIGPGKAI